MSPKKAKGDKKPKDDGKKRKRRTKKDTGVKRSCSAYIYFTKSFREELKAKALKDNTTVPKANEVAKLAGERWKTLSETERKPFEDLAAKDKARYLQEVRKHEFRNRSKLNSSTLLSETQNGVSIYIPMRFFP